MFSKDFYVLKNIVLYYFLDNITAQKNNLYFSKPKANNYFPLLTD